MTGRAEQRRGSDAAWIASQAGDLAAQLGRPAILGISGFGGAGKSTLAANLRGLLAGSVVVPGDEFLRDRPTTTRSVDWAAMDRRRLLEEVLLPTRRGGATRYQTLDWDSGRLGPWVPVDGSVVIVEGLALFHPELVDHFDLRVWIDVDLDTATAQGMWRDEQVWANPQTELWLDVWRPNDADFFDRFRPDLRADLWYRPPGEPCGADERRMGRRTRAEH